MQKGIAKQAPELLLAFDFLYAHVAYCFFYTSGSATPVGRCEITDGVQQGEVFGPLFFSLALDVLLSMLRARMLDLPVDSTMVGQMVEVCAQTEGLVDGVTGSVPLLVGTKVKLLEAPHFSAIEGANEEVRRSACVTVQLLGPDGGGQVPAGLPPIVLPWDVVRLRAHVLICAYLDDIKSASELFLLRPFTLLLRELGPRTVGLHFVKLAKNYAYVPRPFAGMLREMYGEAAFVVDDETEGETPAEKLKVGAEALNGVMTRLLVTTCGIESLMGAPLRTIVLDGNEETDRRWLKDCIHRNAVETQKLFTHLGLSGVNDALRHRGLISGDLDDVPALGDEQSQLRFLLGRYCIMPRLKHLAQLCPPSVVTDDLRQVDFLGALMTMGVMNIGRDGLSATKMDRILLPTRHSGVCPGNAPTAAGDWVTCSAKVESQILCLGELLEGEGRLPSALKVLCDNLRGREGAIANSSLSGLEMELKRSVEDVADALRAAKANRLGNSRGGNSRLAPTGVPPPLRLWLQPGRSG